MSTDVRVKGLTGNEGARLVWVEATGLARHQAYRHHLKGAPAKVAAELLIANQLMGAYVKGEERVSLQFQGDRPHIAFHGEVDAEGGYRGMFTSRSVVQPGRPLRGVMFAIKSNNHKELYRGATPVDDCTVEEALQTHVTQSDQVAAIVRVMVELDDKGGIARARGLLLERLRPDGEGRGMTREAFGEAFDEVRTADVEDLTIKVAFGALGGGIDVLDSQPLQWVCRCSQAKIESTLYSLGPANLREMLEEDGQAEVICHFGNKAWMVDGPRLQELLDAHKGTPEA